jgi:hypothetical protein
VWGGGSFKINYLKGCEDTGRTWGNGLKFIDRLIFRKVTVEISKDNQKMVSTTSDSWKRKSRNRRESSQFRIRTRQRQITDKSESEDREI